MLEAQNFSVLHCWLQYGTKPQNIENPCKNRIIFQCNSFSRYNPSFVCSVFFSGLLRSFLTENNNKNTKYKKCRPTCGIPIRHIRIFAPWTLLWWSYDLIQLGQIFLLFTIADILSGLFIICYHACSKYLIRYMLTLSPKIYWL
jgi:hypothetical protein